MKRWELNLRTLALESAPGRFGFAAVKLAEARIRNDPYARARALLRAWRANHHPLVVRQAKEFLGRSLMAGGQPVPLSQNPLLRAFVQGEAAREIRREFAGYSLDDRVRLRYPRTDEDDERPGDLIVLKASSQAEKGVVLIKYTEAVERFAALFQVERLVARYMIVLEPSWWGYQEPVFFTLVGSDADVVVQAQARADFDFIAEHGFGLLPVRLGAGDWIDLDLFSPSEAQRRFDVVMVSSWNPFKRHEDLFAALSQVKQESGRALRTALIGYPGGWTVADIRERLRRRGLAEQCELFNEVSQSDVAEIVSRSRLYVLLSQREGANKAMYEAMFCDTPVLAPRDHRGINHEHLNAETGATFNRGELATSILSVLDRSETYSPRRWALRNTGYLNATEKLNETLAGMAARAGRAWQQPLVPKLNGPNLQYASRDDLLALEAEYGALAEYLRPVQ